MSLSKWLLGIFWQPMNRVSVAIACACCPLPFNYDYHERFDRRKQFQDYTVKLSCAFPPMHGFSTKVFRLQIALHCHSSPDQLKIVLGTLRLHWQDGTISMIHHENFHAEISISKPPDLNDDHLTNLLDIWGCNSIPVCYPFLESFFCPQNGILVYCSCP